MTVRRDPTQLMQIGFLALLSISVATVGWWMYDGVRYARSVEQRFASDPAVAEDSEARVNRILWEGGFFLVVLIGGMTVLTRTLRHDAELRRRQQNFLAAVSHEFKSPLASIQLGAETLTRTPGGQIVWIAGNPKLVKAMLAGQWQNEPTRSLG